MDMFTGFTRLGECHSFALEDDRAISSLKIRHDLPDGWMGSLVRIILDDSTHVDCDVEGKFFDADNNLLVDYTFDGDACKGFDRKAWVKTTTVEDLIELARCDRG